MASLTMTIQYVNNTSSDVVGFNLRSMWELFDHETDMLTVPAGERVTVMCSPIDLHTIWPNFSAECTRLGVDASKKFDEADKFSMGY